MLTGYRDEAATMRFLRRGVTRGMFTISKGIVSTGEVQVCKHCNGRGFIEHPWQEKKNGKNKVNHKTGDQRIR